jgi:hypothetical protein
MSPFGSEYATVAAGTATLFNASPAAAASAAGDTMVAWQQYDTTGNNGWDVYVQRYDSQGTAQGSAVLANNLIRNGCQRSPAIAADPAGNFVVAWEDDGANIRARLFPATGAAANELLVNSSTSSARRERPAVAFVPATLGRFIVVWQSDQGGSSLDVYARTFNASGGPAPVAEWVVNGPLTGGAGAQHSAAVAYGVAYDATTRIAADRFIVAWQSDGTSANGSEVRRCAFDTSGNPVGGTLGTDTVVETSPGSHGQPAIAADPSGNVVIAWESVGPGTVDRDILARSFKADGTALSGGSDVLITTNSPIPAFNSGAQRSPVVYGAATGDFFVAWQSEGQDGSGSGVFGQLLSSTLARRGDPFGINTTTPPSTATGDHIAETVGGGLAGNLMAAWQDVSVSGGSSVISRRLQIPGWELFTLAPCRFLDTRIAGQGGPFAASEIRTYTLPASCGVATSARAVSLNVTSINPAGNGNFAVFPGDAPAPATSTLNFISGLNRANNAIGILNRDLQGKLSVKASFAAADLLLDVSGYLAATTTAPAAGKRRFFPLPPCRFLDTRSAGGGGPFTAPNQTRAYTLQGSTCGIPLGAKSAVLNVTAVGLGGTAVGDFQLYPTGPGPAPNTTTVSLPSNQNVPNGAVIPLGATIPDLTVSLRSCSSCGTGVHLVIDVVGFFE